MHVRPITEDELPMLVDELWLPFAEEMADIDPYHQLADDIRTEAIEFRQGRLDDEDVRTFLAETDDSAVDGGHAIAGYAVVVANDSPPVFARGREATLEELYVRPDYRNRGIATQLVQRVERWAKAGECEYIGLGVDAANETAQELYGSRGYSVRRHEMRKPLAVE